MKRPQVVPSAEVVKIASPLLTTKELAQYLKCAPASAEKWRSQKKGPPFVRTVYGIRYRLEDVNAWRALTEEVGVRMDSRRRAAQP